MSSLLISGLFQSINALFFAFPNIPVLNSFNLFPFLAGIPALLSLILYVLVRIRQQRTTKDTIRTDKSNLPPLETLTPPLTSEVHITPSAIKPDIALPPAESPRLRVLSGMIENIRQEQASYPPASLPWAENQQQLGDLYFEASTLIKNDALVFLQEAIRMYETALTIYTPENALQKWAELHYKIAQCHYELGLNDAPSSLEAALQYAKRALSVYTVPATPQELAKTEMLLGDIYQHRAEGDQRQNLDNALACYQMAQSIYTVTTNPREWASAMYAQGLIYSKLIGSERHTYLEKAIACYKAALEVYNKQGRSALLDNAQTLYQLAKAYTDLSGTEIDNANRYLQTAITSYQSVLPIYDREHYPLQRAAVLNDLGRTYLNNPLGDHMTMLKKALECHEEALQLYSPETSPDEWAWTQCYLGDAYREYSRTTINHAREHYQLALSIPEAKAPVRHAHNRLKEIGNSPP